MITEIQISCGNFHSNLPSSHFGKTLFAARVELKNAYRIRVNKIIDSYMLQFYCYIHVLFGETVS